MESLTSVCDKETLKAAFAAEDSKFDRMVAFAKQTMIEWWKKIGFVVISLVHVSVA